MNPFSIFHLPEQWAAKRKSTYLNSSKISIDTSILIEIVKQKFYLGFSKLKTELILSSLLIKSNKRL